MARVPYSPVPEIAVQGTAARGPNVQAPLSAFGGATAEALSTLGQTLERSGNELFGRAIALQNLNNDTEAREADSKYMVAAGQLHAEYNALQGKDRVDAFPKYQKDLQDARVAIRSTLSNPMAQKMYDGSSLSTMGRSIFNGAGAAAAANKEWTINTTKAQLELDVKTIEDNPADPALFAQKLKRIQNSARNLAAQQGLGQGPQEDALVRRATSKAWAQRITGLSRTAPFEAAKMLDENKTQLTSDDYLRVDNAVRAQGRATGSVNIANEVYDPDKTLAEMEEKAEARAKELNPDDPLLGKQAVAALRTKYNQTKYAKRQEELEARDGIAGLIQQHNPRNMQELLAIPEAQSLVERLPKEKQLAIPGQINRYNLSKDQFDNDANFTRIKGMSLSDDPAAREEFLNLDPTKEKLSQAQIRAVQAQQAKLKENTSGDPRVQNAIKYLRGSMGAQLEALGIYSRDRNNPQDFDQFAGAISSALDVWKENHGGKPATAKDITDTIGPQIVRERTEPGWFWNSKVPFFKQTVPEDFATKARAISQNPNLSDAAIYKLYTRMQYQELYAKPGPKDQSRAK